MRWVADAGLCVVSKRELAVLGRGNVRGGMEEVRLTEVVRDRGRRYARFRIMFVVGEGKVGDFGAISVAQPRLSGTSCLGC